ncbi:hypothetical protein D3C79_978520 [compost metagenome]
MGWITAPISVMHMPGRTRLMAAYRLSWATLHSWRRSGVVWPTMNMAEVSPW